MIVMETEGIQSCSDKRSLKTPHRNIKTVLPCVCVCVFVRVCVCGLSVSNLNSVEYATHRHPSKYFKKIFQKESD